MIRFPFNNLYAGDEDDASAFFDNSWRGCDSRMSSSIKNSPMDLSRFDGRQARCPRCAKGPMVNDSSGAELFCSNCGYVMKEQIVDAGREWRAFSTEEANQRAHTGAPSNLSELKRHFDNAIDCGLFHVFTDVQRGKFVESLCSVLTPNGKYFMLCFSDLEPEGWGGPWRVTQKEIEESLF